MEEKNINKDESKHADTEPSAGAVTGVDDAKAKPKLSEKIKEKLHIHKH